MINRRKMFYLFAIHILVEIFSMKRCIRTWRRVNGDIKQFYEMEHFLLVRKYRMVRFINIITNLVLVELLSVSKK